MDNETRRRIAQHTILLAPTLDVEQSENKTFANENLFCPHCVHYVTPRIEFKHNTDYVCKKCNTTSRFIVWSTKPDGTFKALLSPIN